MYFYLYTKLFLKNPEVMNSFSKQTRRNFIGDLSVFTAAALFPGSTLLSCRNLPGSKMKLGLVTYLWAKDWDIPTIIGNCTEANIPGVELRVEHAHGVTLDLSRQQREEVRKQFAGSAVEIIGMGTNEQYDWPDPERLKQSIDTTKAWLQLSKDIGGSGVKVKPNQFHEGIPQAKTLEQIGKALNELGRYALNMGQQIRLEVHGVGTQELPNIAKIMEYVENVGSTVCWNSNSEDLNEPGLEFNFNLVKDYFGDICHVRELNLGDYPYQQLMNLFVRMDYKGWILLECRTDPEDKVAALKEQREVFEKMIKNAQNL